MTPRSSTGTRRRLGAADSGAKGHTYRNPIVFADYSDPDVIRHGNSFYLVASSFNCAPGLPILHSHDLVNWEILNYAVKNLPHPRYDEVQPGCGIWAPAIRFHDGRFWIFFPMPDEGIYMTTATDPAREWSKPHLVQAGKGLIDPCPFWDEDGQAYLVHAWAKSRAGIQGILSLCRMTVDGRKLLDQGTVVFDGGKRHPTIEGPKLYRRNGYYYIFAPAGGVENGWQTVLRSTNIFGPYDDRIVLTQGNTRINGPHQGGWVETPSGESWFIHFQDRGAYGRVLHLQPVHWVDDWPVIGNDSNGDGTGEPVLAFPKPRVGRRRGRWRLATSDEFNSRELGLTWQWQANYRNRWCSLSARPGWLRLFCAPERKRLANLWRAPNLLLQKFPAEKFSATAKLDVGHLPMGEQAGLIVMGQDYSYVTVRQTPDGCRVARVVCRHADKDSPEIVQDTAPVRPGSAVLRVDVRAGAVCTFSYSVDGKRFVPLGKPFTARKGNWIGAKVGVFCSSVGDGGRKSGYADFDWFRVS
ncbi:MAG TPA: glycoside hydrolase 43 family protein [Verrucomicrobiae bacterium]|nr:glycoside hydrolase 43 family protein [Verrucomicrobiae bacterium]